MNWIYAALFVLGFLLLIRGLVLKAVDQEQKNIDEENRRFKRIAQANSDSVQRAAGYPHRRVDR